MPLKSPLIQYFGLLLLLVALVSCEISANSSEDSTDYALKNSTDFKDVKGYMVYAHMDTHLTYMELRLRNLHTGDDEILLSTKNTDYTTMMPSSVSSDGQLIFVDVQKSNTKKSFMLLYDLKKRTYKELNIGHSAIAGDISPDKSKLVFYSDFNDQYDYSIYISNLEGNNRIKLECPKTKCWHPSWNEDSSKITYIADDSLIYVYNTKTKHHNLLYKLTNKRKYELNYPKFYNNDIYFSKNRKSTSPTSDSNTEIIKLSNNKLSTFFKSKDSFYSISFISPLIYLSGVSSNNIKKKYSKILIHSIKVDKHLSLTTSDISKFQNDTPIFIGTL